MTLDIVIPSKWRREKLDHTLNSLFLSIEKCPNPSDVRVFIYFSEESEYQHYWSYFNGIPNVRIQMVTDYNVPSFWNSHLRSMVSDAMVCCNDDLEFEPDTISTILAEYPFKYPDNDGIMGMNQCNLPTGQGMDFAFCIIGREYSRRFPDYEVWCPDYKRFYCDRELGDYAKSIGKFTYNPNIRINHFHPCVNRALVDHTHEDVRTHLGKDKTTFQRREIKGYLWGRDFNLINKD